MFRSEFLFELCDSNLYKIVSFGHVKTEQAEPDKWIKMATDQCLQRARDRGINFELSSLDAILVETAADVRKILDIKADNKKTKCFLASAVKKDDLLLAAGFRKVLVLGFGKEVDSMPGEFGLAILLQAHN